MRSLNPPIKWLKPPIFLLCLAPFLHLAWKAWQQNLGANPVEEISTTTGIWTLNFLVITLAVSPLRKITSQPWLVRFRRMFGLFAFFYVCLHFTAYIWLDQNLDFASTLKDVAKRPFITAGFAAFLLLIPLALTSTTGWIRRLGGARWQMLHRLIYLSGLAGGVHYYWKVKSDVRQPLLYLAIIGLLLGFRLIAHLTEQRARKSVAVRERHEITTSG